MIEVKIIHREPSIKVKEESLQQDSFNAKSSGVNPYIVPSEYLLRRNKVFEDYHHMYLSSSPCMELKSNAPIMAVRFFYWIKAYTGSWDINMTDECFSEKVIDGNSKIVLKGIKRQKLIRKLNGVYTFERLMDWVRIMEQYIGRKIIIEYTFTGNNRGRPTTMLCLAPGIKLISPYVDVQSMSACTYQQRIMIDGAEAEIRENPFGSFLSIDGGKQLLTVLQNAKQLSIGENSFPKFDNLNLGGLMNHLEGK